MADPRSEPSMEDILASIKRIIADDPALPPTPPAPVVRSDLPRASAWPAPAPAVFERPPAWPTPTEPPRPPEAILELTNLVPEESPPPRVPPISRAAPEPPHQAPPSWPEPPIQHAADRPRQPDISWGAPQEAAPPPSPRSPSPRTAAPRDIGEVIVNRAAGGDNTLEGLVRDMLRPMLSDWIDAHLPAMVERLVQNEIRKMMEREGGAE